jgi:DNA-binding NarL/FixJ family response regulator
MNWVSAAELASTREVANSAVVVVEDRATELAVLAALGVEGGWAHEQWSACVCVSSRDPSPEGPTVLVVPAMAAACASALDAVISRTAMAAMSADELDQLSAVVVAVAQGVRCLSDAVVRLAADMPILGARGRNILGLAATGASVAQMASSLHLSTATVKRELAELSDLLGCQSRVELLLAARRLGIL